MYRIEHVGTADQVEDIRRLFREYESWLGLSLCFQGFEEELQTLPGKYAEPEGRLFIAYVDDEPAGCIGLRKLEDGICEMKRLYLRPVARGHGLGNALIERLITVAKEVGYKKMRLDTFPPKMGKAVGLYESHGFRTIEPYYDNPHGGTLFMELDL
jgi:GNAT superfamily N-acetyltransferase